MEFLLIIAIGAIAIYLSRSQSQAAVNAPVATGDATAAIGGSAAVAPVGTQGAPIRLLLGPPIQKTGGSPAGPTGPPVPQPGPIIAHTEIFTRAPVTTKTNPKLNIKGYKEL